MLDYIAKIVIGITSAISAFIFGSEPSIPNIVSNPAVQERLASTTIPTPPIPAVIPKAVVSTSTAKLKPVENKIKKTVVTPPEVKLLKEVATSTPSSSSIITKTSGPFLSDPKWKDSIVNLLCADRYGEIDSVLSGSGVMIDKRGVILTNAHVGINFVFADWPEPSLYNCSVRVGSPAYPLYRATLLYLPDEFAKKTLSQLYAVDDSETVYGVKDYALLLITSRTDPTKSLPSEFPYIPFSISDVPTKGSYTHMMGYSAGFLGGITILQNLNLASSQVIVENVKSLTGFQSPDVLAFKGSIAGQHGSSGGAVIDNNGRVTAIPTFLDENPGISTDDNVLNAITVEYVNNDLKKDTGFSIQEFLDRADLLSVAQDFMKNRVADYQRSFAEIVKEKQGIAIPGYNNK